LPGEKKRVGTDAPWLPSKEKKQERRMNTQSCTTGTATKEEKGNAHPECVSPKKRTTCSEYHPGEKTALLRKSGALL